MIKLEPMRILAILFLLLLPISFSWASDLVIEDARAYRDQGYKLQSLGDSKEALVYYQKAIELDPLFTQAYNDLGVVYESLGNDKRAEKMYKKALDLDPGYLGVYTNLAFLYEKRGDIKNASFHWQRRYELGERGEYWWEVARQHLLKLGTYPEIKKERLEQAAARLSRELNFKREQDRLKLLEEAKLHLDIASQAFKEGDYIAAIKECNVVLSLNPPNEELKTKAREIAQASERLRFKEKAFADTNNALEYLRSGDYLSAGEKLKSALEATFHISQE